MVNLSICIPSFNRYEALNEQLEYLLKSSLNVSKISEIIFIDDGYDLNISQSITDKYQEFSKFKYHKNLNSGSFGHVYSECFKAASSDYVLITNDDDILFINGIKESFEFISENPLCDLIIPVWLSNVDRVIRGNKKLSRCIKPDEILKFTAHAPGLIYKVSIAKNFISMLDRRLSINCSFSQMYPQVFISSLLLNNSSLICLSPTIIGKDGHGYPTEIGLKDSGSYFSLKSRVLQYYALLEIQDSKIFKKVIIESLCINFLSRIGLLQKRRILLRIFRFITQRLLLEIFVKYKSYFGKLIKRKR